MSAYLADFYVLSALLCFSAYALIVRAGTSEYSAYSASQIMTWGNLVLLGGFGLWRTPLGLLTPSAVGFFIGSGVFGYTLSRTMLYLGFERIGVSRTTAIHGLAPLLSAGMAIFWLGEEAGGPVVAGTVAIMAGVWLIGTEGGGEEGGGKAPWSRRDLVFPFMAALGTAFSMVFRKKGLLVADAPALGTAISCLVALPLLPLARRAAPRMEGRRCTRRGLAYLGAAAVVNSLAQFALMRALLTAGVAYTVPLYSATPLVVLGLSALFLRRVERVSLRLFWAVCLTVSGAVLITVSRHGLLG